MLLDEALTLVRRLIFTGEKHPDYTRTVELAETYLTYITGLEELIAKKLRRFTPRESEIMFAQRVNLTKSITPAIAASLRTPFSKVTRNNRIKNSVKLQNETRQKAVEEMIKGFYGAKQKKNRGLVYWLNTRFLELNFSDPNSWVVAEWDAPESRSDIVQPCPFEVSAYEAVNYFSANDTVKWLFVQQNITMLELDANAQPGIEVLQYKKAAGLKFTLYDEDVTVVYEQIDPKYMQATNYQLMPGEYYEVINKNTFIVRTFSPNLGYPPVFRVGYKRDEATKGRTFVNPWHDALCFFEKSLKTVSELDLTMTLHAFPQKIQYVQKCNGPSRAKRCDGGLLIDGTTCPSCNGSGQKLVTTTQDAILLPMPEDPKDMVDLNDIMVYKAPAIDIIQFQNDYIQQLKRETHQAVFNSQAMVQTTISQGNTRQSAERTATEVNTSMESVYDAIEPFTQKYSEFFIDIVTTMALLTGEPVEKVVIVHEFPVDFKMKGEDLLLAERANAAASGAPSFLMESIDDDLAAIVYQGDADSLHKYRTQQSYFPFSGMTPDEVVMAVTSEFVPKADKVLYYNYSQIFSGIEESNPDFYKMTDRKKQRVIVDEAVKAFIAVLDAQAPVVPDIRETNPLNTGNGGNDAQDDNPGDNNPGSNTDDNPAGNENTNE